MAASLVTTPRKFQRYCLQVRLRFSWRDRDGTSHTLEGVTRDISINSVYVKAVVAPPVDSEIEFEVYLPAVGSESATLHIDAHGRVCRTEMLESLQGFAVLSARKFRVSRPNSR